MRDNTLTAPLSSLPKPWEEERTFGDALSDWLQGGPWFAISLILHLVAYFVVSAIPWHLLERTQDKPVVASIEPTPPQELVEPPPEVVKQIREPVPTEEPVLVDNTVVDEVQSETNLYSDSQSNDSPFQDSPFDANAFNDLIGIAGGGGRRGSGGPGWGRVPGGGGLAATVDSALDWLARHQAPDGSWDADGFDHNRVRGEGDSGDCDCGGHGHATHDVGLTGLSLLAFLGVGQSSREGRYRETVARGLTFLREVQDPDTGLIGSANSREYLYDHAIATLALCDAYYATRSPLLKRSVQTAVHFIQRARNPYGAWRYDSPPIGNNDTSVTGWMVFALAAAQDAGLEVDDAAFDGALSWLDEVTDTSTGRVGYDSYGSLSARTAANDHFPREKSEAMTAVGLLCRIFIAHARGEELTGDELTARQAELLLRAKPEWDPAGFGCDMYSWYYGTYAMYQLGGREWEQWRRAMEPAIQRSQRTDGHAEGSWDPVGPWGHAGGRVYATAIQTLSLEVYLRHARVFGAR